MKVLLIKPPSLYSSRNGGGIDLPFGLLAIAAATQDIADISILDIDALEIEREGVAQIIQQYQPDMVGITCWITSFPYVKWLTEVIVEMYPAIPIVGGGPFATVAPELYLEHTAINVVVVGEGEITFRLLLKALQENKPIGEVPGIAYSENGKIRYSPINQNVVNLDDVPFYPYELIPMDRYLQIPFWFPFWDSSWKGTSILTDRGCPHQCSFCNPHYLGTYRKKNPENVEREVGFLRNQYGVGALLVCDAILTMNREKIIDMSNIMAKWGMKWFGQTRVDYLIKYADLLPLMVESGCIEIWLGFENANQDVLNNVGKGTTIRENIKAIDLLRKAGIKPILFVLLGLPGDTERSIGETISFVKSEGLFANPSTLYLIPQTPLWDYAVSKNKAPDVLSLVTRFADEYFQSNRTKAFPNLSNVSDEKIAEAINEIWEYSQTLKAVTP